MTLNVNSTLSLTGTNGIAGTAGAGGTPTSLDGHNGTNGGAGADVHRIFAHHSYHGDAGADQVILSRSTFGGTGGSGGGGGTGWQALATAVTITGPGFVQHEFNYSLAGNGGQAAASGSGGIAVTRFAHLTFDLASGSAIDVVTQTANAQGGTGGAGNNGGLAGIGGQPVNRMLQAPSSRSIRSPLVPAQLAG